MKKKRQKIESDFQIKTRYIYILYLLWGFFTIFFGVLIIFLFDYSRLIFQRIEYYFPIGYFVLFAGILFIGKKLNNSHSLTHILHQKRILNIILISGIIFIFLLPLIWIPANVINGPIHPKPKIIAHRGGTYLGPENTIPTFQTSMQYGIVGIEIDVRISKDGVPFLLHDENFFRTTNIAEIFPERKLEKAESFTIGEIQQLNAGLWYINEDPYQSIAKGIINRTQVEKYRNIKIPTYAEVIEFTRDNNLEIDLDLWLPPENHEYYNPYFEIIFNITQENHFNWSQILLPTEKEGYIPSEVEDQWLALLDRNNITDIQLGWEGNPSVSSFRTSRYTYINTADTYTNEQYKELYQERVPTMVFTIDCYERFTELWCLGVTWIKTNAPHLFIDNIPKGVWTTTSYYLYMVFLMVGNIIVWVKNSPKKTKLGN